MITKYNCRPIEVDYLQPSNWSTFHINSCTLMYRCIKLMLVLTTNNIISFTNRQNIISYKYLHVLCQNDWQTLLYNTLTSTIFQPITAPRIHPLSSDIATCIPQQRIIKELENRTHSYRSKHTCTLSTKREQTKYTLI